MKHGKGHDPSKYRALVREAKAGKGIDKLIAEARRLEDPYFVALAMFDLSADKRLELKKAASIAEEALATAGKVERPWRRAELLGIIAKKVGSWRGKNAAKHKEAFLDRILDAVESMPEGKGLSDAIAGCAPRLGCDRLLPLLAKAASNKGFEIDCSKVVLRHWAQKCGSKGPAPDELVDMLEKVKDNAMRSRLFGYLHLQCKRSKISAASTNLLQAAVESALMAVKEERLEVLRYLAGQSSTKKELELVAGAMDRLDEPIEKARLAAALGASAHRAGLEKMALSWFKEGIKVASQIEDRKKRASTALNLARGLEKCGETELAQEAYQMVKHKERKKDVKKTQVPEKMGINHMLALYDTYEGGLKPVHVRAVARAAPLCTAFGLDLALVGFPTDDLDGLVSMVIADTNVGKGGRYLRELVKQGRVALVPCTKHRPPEDWEGVGLPVATTSRPKGDKKVGMAEAVQLARSQHPLRRVCLIMGLGKRGLPASLLDSVQYHLELTGSNVPLETCAAMGVIAQQLRSEEEEV